MSKFFDSSIIREEMEEIFNIQKELYQVIMQFGSMDDQEKREHMEKLKTLLDKQEVMWTRLSLSDDPEAIEMKEKIRMTSAAMGFKDVDMNVIFKNMRSTLDNLAKRLDTP
tara:strand:+ start:146 stop:478 length:333 start_codon:yes stop_codon:yes gene_type:complete